LAGLTSISHRGKMKNAYTILLGSVISEIFTENMPGSVEM